MRSWSPSAAKTDDLLHRSAAAITAATISGMRLEASAPKTARGPHLTPASVLAIESTRV